MAGLTGNTTLYSSAIQYVIFLVTTGIILPYIDRVGRRTLLLIGAVSSLILHFTIAGVMATQGQGVDSVEGNTNLKWEVSGASGKAVIALSYIFVGVYGFTWAPVGWIYCSEVFPLKYRAKGVGKRLQSQSERWMRHFANRRSPPPRSRGRHKLGVQLRSRLLRRPSFQEHPMEDVHYLRRPMHGNDLPHLLHLPRNCRTYPGRDRLHLRMRPAGLEDW